MKKIMSGILAVTLLSSLYFLKIDRFEIDYVNSFGISMEESMPVGEMTEIDKKMMRINENNSKIDLLTNHVKRVSEHIKAEMGSKARTKIAMSEKQMTAFKAFSDVYTLTQSNIMQALSKSETVIDFQNLKKEIMRDNTDFAYVEQELSSINEYQHTIITMLRYIIDKGEETLEILL